MQSRDELVDTYARSHRHPVNRAIHLICVPVILFATIGLAWSARPAHVTGLAHGINLAWPLAAAMLWGYARLGRRAATSGAAWIAAALAASAALDALGVPLLAMSLGLWLLAWLAQFAGHALERAKPAFSDNLVFLLVGPLFVQDELLARARRPAA